MQDDTLGRKIAGIHAQIQGHVGDIGRIGIPLYHADSGQLSTFVHSSDGQSPLERYQVPLAEVPSLRRLHEDGHGRIIDDLASLAGAPSEHTRRILAAGFRSSYTCPLYAQGELLGFLFFDSRQPGHFRNDVTLQLDSYAQLISSLVSHALSATRALRSAMALTRELGRHRDEETADHLDRVAHYTRSIAMALPERLGHSDEDVEFLFQFAGLHFDDALLAALRARGVELGHVTLHVGAGTFQPMRVDDIREHRMHSEWINVGAELVAQVRRTRAAGGRVVAVGTTVLRALESAYQGGALDDGELQPFAGETSIFIFPGYRIRSVDALLTNFHLPESTLLMLVSAFAGKPRIFAAYEHAVRERYRFFSYGDAMLLWPQETGA